MMYKRVLLVIGVAVLAALTGVGAVHSAGASQKSTVATAGPPANDVKLSANSTIASNSGCAVTAWVHNQNYSISGYLLKFHKVPPGPPTVWTTGTSNANGKVNVLVPWSTTIVATTQSNTVLLTSNTFICPAKNPPQ